MKALVIGATGYVGLRISMDLLAHGYATHGLARSQQNHARLQEAGIAPLDGDTARMSDLAETVKSFDVIVFAAKVQPFTAETAIVRQLLRAMQGTGHSLVFISGSGVVSLAAPDGAWNENTFAEDDPFPFPELPTRRVRLRTEALIREAATNGVRSFVIRPPLIWGHGGSTQIPQLFESARLTGTVCYLGQGLNLYSHAHVDDVATVSRLAIERGTPGASYHVVAGEVAFRSIAEAVATVVECPTRSLDYSAACELWGARWVDMGLAVNSRIRAPRTRAELGWAPQHVDLIEDIRAGSYRAAYLRGGFISPAYPKSETAEANQERDTA